MSTLLPERLRSARLAKGLSARQLSLAADLSQSMVGQIERGDVADPGVSVVLKLAEQLGVGVEWLLGRDKSEPPAAA